MSVQLEFIEKNLEARLESTRGWVGRLQNRINEIDQQLKLVQECRRLRGSTSPKPRIIQLDIKDIL